MSIDSPMHIANRHDFNATYTNEFDSNQTNLSIISPTGNNKIKVTGVYIAVEGSANQGFVKLGFSGNTVAKAYIGAGQTLFDFKDILVSGANGEDLKLNSTLGSSQNFLVVVNYKDGI